MMRFPSLAQEFEDVVEAFRSGAPEALYGEAGKLQARVTRHDVELSRTPQELHRLSYELGALEAAAGLLTTTASRAEQTSILDNLLHRKTDLRVLRQLGLWALHDDEPAGEAVTTSSRSQKALAEASGVSEAALSRTILKRLRGSGLVAEPRRARTVHAEITAAGIAALDQVIPGWQDDTPMHQDDTSMHGVLPTHVEAMHAFLREKIRYIVGNVPLDTPTNPLFELVQPSHFPSGLVYGAHLLPPDPQVIATPLSFNSASFLNKEVEKAAEDAGYAKDEYAFISERLRNSVEAVTVGAKTYKPLATKRLHNTSMIGHWRAQQASHDTHDKEPHRV